MNTCPLLAKYLGTRLPTLSAGGRYSGLSSLIFQFGLLFLQATSTKQNAEHHAFVHPQSHRLVTVRIIAPALPPVNGVSCLPSPREESRRSTSPFSSRRVLLLLRTSVSDSAPPESCDSGGCDTPHTAFITVDCSYLVASLCAATS